MKMSTPQEKAQCVSWFIETKSVIQAQQNFGGKYGKKPPARPTIRAWHKKFMETGSVLQRKGAGRPQISENKIESVLVAYTRNPRKSIRGLLSSYRSHAPLFTKFWIETCDFIHVKCSCCKPLTLFSSTFFEVLTPQRLGFRSPAKLRFITQKLLKLSL